MPHNIHYFFQASESPNNKPLQDQQWVDYTNRNIQAGMRSGALKQTDSAEKIAGFAKAAHLKGSGGANNLYLKGKDSADANGMRVSTYAQQAKKSMLLAPKIQQLMTTAGGYIPNGIGLISNASAAENTATKPSALSGFNSPSLLDAQMDNAIKLKPLSAANPVKNAPMAQRPIAEAGGITGFNSPSLLSTQMDNAIKNKPLAAANPFPAVMVEEQVKKAAQTSTVIAAPDVAPVAPAITEAAGQPPLILQDIRQNIPDGMPFGGNTVAGGGHIPVDLPATPVNSDPTLADLLSGGIDGAFGAIQSPAANAVQGIKNTVFGGISEMMPKGILGQTQQFALNMPEPSKSTTFNAANDPGFTQPFAEPQSASSNVIPLLSAKNPAPSGGGNVNQTITITINATPGMNEQQIADLVAKKLREAERRTEINHRGRMYDG